MNYYKDSHLTSPSHGLLAKLGVDAEVALMEEGIGPDPDAAVYLSGSLVEGFGNRGSDIDIFVVGSLTPSSSGMLIHKEHFTISLHYYDQRRVDFEYWPEAPVLSLADRLATMRLGEDFVAEKLASVEELFIHRLHIGLPLRTPERLEELRALFDRRRFCQYLTQQSIHRIDGAVEDIAGMLDDQHYEVAVLRSRDLAALATDAYGHSLGNTNPLPKWRSQVLRVLQRNHPDDLRLSEVKQKFWELQFPSPAKGLLIPSSAERYANDCLEFAERVVQWIQG